MKVPNLDRHHRRAKSVLLSELQLYLFVLPIAYRRRMYAHVVFLARSMVFGHVNATYWLFYRGNHTAVSCLASKHDLACSSCQLRTF
jgi:hypothetical protein